MRRCTVDDGRRLRRGEPLGLDEHHCVGLRLSAGGAGVGVDDSARRDRTVVLVDRLDDCLAALRWFLLIGTASADVFPRPNGQLTPLTR